MNYSAVPVLDTVEWIAERYEVMHELGRGGMAGVYAVRDTASGRLLALKRLEGRRGKTLSTRNRQRFRREFHTLAHLAHPRVIEVYEFGLDDSHPFYTMELLDGRDLRELAPAPVADACRLIRDAAAALAFLHSRRLLHRDLSPRNVRCTSDGRAKLIDFGVLATIGSTPELAGTPPFIAPESLRGLPLDPRADLFGLGALCYWLLTGEHAFPARNLRDLELSWRRRPRAPSELVSGIPPELDELVLALLRTDPVGRPPTAADVIDRLGAITSLAPLTDQEVARGYLASSALVGRRNEVDHLARLLDSAVRGRGRAVLIEAPSGSGKSRLLRELRLRGQLVGAVVVEIDGATAGSGPLAGIRQLTRELVAALPDKTMRATAQLSPLLVQVLPELRNRLGAMAVAAPSSDPAENRVRLLTQLMEFVFEIAETCTLVILVDDLQRVDDASSALLALLAQSSVDRSILIAGASRADEAPHAPEALAAFREAAGHLRLAGLGVADVRQLVRELFGVLPDGDLVAQRIHEQADGRPLLLLELLHALFDAGAITYTDGLWSVDRERLERFEAPGSLVAALDARVARLGPAARNLGEALAVHGSEISVDLCARLVDNDETALALLDELIVDEFLVGAGDHYRIRHDGVRQALLRGLDDVRRRELHLQIARTLEELGAADDEASEAALGWHFLQGGARLRGARLLERAGRRHHDAQSFRDLIPLLEATLEVYESEQVSPRLCLELCHMLLAAGCVVDRSVVLRWADKTIDAHYAYSGMDLAQRAARLLGTRLAIAVGLGWAGIRWLFTTRKRRGPTPLVALRELFVVVGYVFSVSAVCLDLDRCRRLIEFVRPLAAFSGRIPAAAHLTIDAMVAFITGHFSRARAGCHEVLSILERDRLTRVSEVDRKHLAGPIHFLLALLACLDATEERERHLAALEALDSHFFRVAALVVKISWHRYRGEESQARKLEARLSVHRVELGSVWQMDVQLLTLSAVAYSWIHDVAGLKRSAVALESMVEAGYHPRFLLDLVRGEYHRERGEAVRGAELIRRALASMPSEALMSRALGLAALADSLLTAGEPTAASAVAREGIELIESGIGHEQSRIRFDVVLAQAETELGDIAGGRARLLSVAERAARYRNPAFSGLIAEVQARLALAAGDLAAFRQHLEQMATWIRKTRNPALIARIAALQDQERRRNSPSVAGGEPDSTRNAVTVALPAETPKSPVSLLSGLRDTDERSRRTLEVLMGETGAAGGALFLWQSDALQLAAFEGQPPHRLRALVRALIDAKVERAAQPHWSDLEYETSGDGGRWYALVLLAGLPTREVVVGAAALCCRSTAQPPDSLLVAQLAHELFHTGVATGVVVDAETP